VRGDGASVQHKIVELESIRGLAALLVVFFHIPAWNALTHNVTFIRNGYLMVDLFFVLSGFVIYRAYAHRLTSLKLLAEFQFLRFGRLFPVHLLFLSLFLGIEIAKYLAAISLGIRSSNSTPFLQNSWTAFFEQLFLVHAIWPTGNTATFNNAAWSISTEFYTYLLFGTIALCFNRFRNLMFALLAAAAIGLLIVGSADRYSWLLRCEAGFFIGCLTAFAFEKIDRRFVWLPPLVSVGALVVFLMVKTNPVYDPLIYLLTSMLILSIVLTESGKTVLQSKWLVWLGTISYSLYMSHWLIVWSFNQVFRVIFKRPEIVVDGVTVPQLSLVETVLASAVMIGIIFIVSQIVYSAVEAPFRKKSRQLILGSPPSIVPIAVLNEA
jgi:peptidoglycan/LPS O-acetylase OafA/YrhL